MGEAELTRFFHNSIIDQLIPKQKNSKVLSDGGPSQTLIESERFKESYLHILFRFLSHLSSAIFIRFYPEITSENYIRFCPLFSMSSKIR